MKSLKGFIFKKISFNFLGVKYFTDCGKSQCGCKGSAPEPDETEKKMKTLNYKIIQCINLGKFDDALELSNDYIGQLKENYSKIKLTQVMNILSTALRLIIKLLF
jgi:hypothetical protein